MSLRNRGPPKVKKEATKQQRSNCTGSTTEEPTTSINTESFLLDTYVQPWPPNVIEAPSWSHGLDVEEKNESTPLRLAHWGPIIALCIIGYISAVTTYFTMMWWPFVTYDGFIHFLAFMLWNYLTLDNMFNASFTGGGFVPYCWNPPKENHKELLQFCKHCNGYKAPRAHHCSKCSRCVMKMDHHCPWINNCVGHRNHGFFCRFLLFAIIGCIHATVIHIICGYHIVHQVWYMRFGRGSEPVITVTFWSLIALVCASAFAFGVTVGLSGLLYFQIKGIWKNKTGIEDYIDQKAIIRRDDEDTEKNTDRWIYPYDLGWKRNCKNILFFHWTGRTKGNGIWWPVAEPCDQFTLTREQLAQKEAKRRLARLVTIIDNFAGGVFASCCFGPKIFFCQPISEETRVKVSSGERWVITQATKYWFYGHKADEENPPKGWFPRKVAKLLDERPYE